MNVVPRQGALLGGLKKAVKGVAKGIGSVLKSDLGKAALLGVGAFGIPGTSFGGLLGRGQGSFLSNLLLFSLFIFFVLLINFLIISIIVFSIFLVFLSKAR